MEWNGIKVLGLSASLLAGRASRLPQMPPGPGQHTTFKNHNHKGQELSTWVHLPFTGGRASPALGAMQEPIPDFRCAEQIIKTITTMVQNLTNCP